MIRFRTGQRWKREPAEAPHDSVSLELDGVNLLPGAVEESLGEVVPALVGAVAELRAGGRRLAQVSLAEAHLELVLRRSGPDIELQVASLSRPARLLRPPLRLDAEELAEATRAGGQAFLEDVKRTAPGRLEGSGGELARVLGLLEAPVHVPEEPRPQPFTQRVAPPTLPGFGFALEDGDDVLRRSAREKGPALASLLCPGEVWLALPERPVAWKAPGPPFLSALELARQAGDLARAMEVGEARFGFEPSGLRPELQLDLRAGEARINGMTVPLRAEALLEAMYHLGQALAVAMSERERSLAGNPYLVELTERCREGLSHLRGAVKAPAEEEAVRAKVAPPVAGASRPLKVPGRLRRLRFESLWEQRKLMNANEGRLLLGRQGVVYSSPEMACAFERKTGRQQWRRAATHGVATTVDGFSVAASGVRLCGFAGRGAGAQWMRGHDALRIGPELHRHYGLLYTLGDERVALALHEVTGREVWRLAPARTRRSFLTVHAHRALLATDSGYLYGLGLADGQVRFRVSASLPFLGPPVPWNKRFVALLGQGSNAALLLSEAHTGEAVWTYEMPLSLPSAPLVGGRRVYVAGESEGEGVLLCVDAAGQTKWRRALHLGPGPFALARLRGAVLVTSALGAAARVSDTGEVDWRVGASGEQLSRALPPVVSRGVVLVPGERVRAVDPGSGDVLAEVRAGAGLMALQADAQLNLYFLDEAGTVSAYKLSSHFAVVGG